MAERREEVESPEQQAFAIIRDFVTAERDGGLSDHGFAAVLMDRLRPHIGRHSAESS